MSLNDDDSEELYSGDGLVVFTAAYLLQRGYCCGNGCLNCPYDYKNVPEPARTRLLQRRKETDESKNNTDHTEG